MEIEIGKAVAYTKKSKAELRKMGFDDLKQLSVDLSSTLTLLLMSTAGCSALVKAVCAWQGTGKRF